MSTSIIGGGIKRCFCLTSDVCLSRTSGVEAYMPKNGKRHTRDSDTTFKVKRSKFMVTRPLYSPQP